MDILFFIVPILIAIPGAVASLNNPIWRKILNRVRLVRWNRWLTPLSQVAAIVAVVFLISNVVISLATGNGENGPIVQPPTSTPSSSPTPVVTDAPWTPCPLVSNRPPIGGPPVDLEVNITAPRHCEQDLAPGEAVRVAGTYSGNLTGKEIWILVYPPNLRYYPASPDACEQLPAMASSGQWVTNIFPGRTGVSEQFDIVLVVADTNNEASNEFKSYLETGCRTGDFPGFIELPNGLTEMDAITVHTRG